MLLPHAFTRIHRLSKGERKPVNYHLCLRISTGVGYTTDCTAFVMSIGVGINTGKLWSVQSGKSVHNEPTVVTK
jgi:hypothetical protein